MHVAVVTDALSDGFFFPLWRRYYGAQFGDANLFVMGYAGGATFDDPALGGVVRLPHGYDNSKRPDACAELIDRLLQHYEAVIRVDADEFLVVDPRVAPSLAAFLESTNDPYYSARGFDVIQLPAEAPLVPGPVLAQRRVAYPNSALNKTAITRMPVRWTTGFHWATVRPRFDGLFMLHLKRIDIDWQVEWLRTMTQNIADHPADNPAVSEHMREYYLLDRERIDAYHQGVTDRPVVRGLDAWYRDDHQERFLASIRKDVASGFYHGDCAHERILCELPDSFRGLL